MSYGHAEKIAAIVAGTPAAGSEKPTPPIDPTLYQRDDMRTILAARDIAALYRVLEDAGFTQRDIARLTGQSQSEVCDILAGRRVLSYDLLVRITEGLAIPRELMGISYGAYRGEVTVASPEGVDKQMLRRQVIELGASVAVGAPAAKLAQLLERLELGDPSPVPLPSQLGAVHVAKVRGLTRQLNEAASTPSGSDPELSSAAAGWATRLLDVSGPESVKQALKTAVGELHIRAGWSGFDGGLYDRAMHHYGHALKLATEARDTYLQVLALAYAGLATQEHGQPDDGLKMLQVGGATALDIPPDEQRAVVVGESGRAAVQAVVLMDEATALSRLDYPEAARAADTALAKARELWQPTPADPYGDLDRPAACLKLERGHLDAAEPFAVASLRRWEGGSQVSLTQSSIVLAAIHVRAGEPRGFALAHSAITNAGRLTSVRARKRLEPLVAALAARRGADAEQLARMARQVAATRA
ncbi:MAG: helix-turn-helix domain-containing protein [Actinomycetota bacterium]|nr:helix-turn-helix domain-containing protein [Actinomycetota bacterium]